MGRVSDSTRVGTGWEWGLEGVATAVMVVEAVVFMDKEALDRGEEEMVGWWCPVAALAGL